jgi:hypothetical protein
MIDLVIGVQALSSSLSLWCSLQEKRSGWDRAGFALLACSAGLMTIRRVTARSADTYATFDRILLPNVITYIFVVAVLCFCIERGLRQLQGRAQQGPADPSPLWRRLLLPLSFTSFFVASACDLVTAPKLMGWTLESFSPARVRNEALCGEMQLEAIETLRQDSSQAIDTLVLISLEDSTAGKAARLKLDQLKKKMETIR